jgi:G3E family GTPase
MSSEKKIPILLVTGFLGSGKTTFINWLLHSLPNTKMSLILNEFGDIKLESQFIQQDQKTEIVELANGCMCCVAKSDIPRSIKLILERSPQTEYIVIEASGLSDPDPVYDALQSDELSSLVSLDSILCIVDTVNFEKNRQEHSIVMSQVGDANSILLSKIEAAGAEKTNQTKQFLERIGIGTHVVLWDEKMKPNFFINTESNQPEQDAKQGSESHHQHEKYDEFWFTSAKQLDLSKYTEYMQRMLPESVVRSKGWINDNGKKILVQYVAGKLDLQPAEWGEEKPSTALLFIGKELPREEILRELATFEV